MAEIVDGWFYEKSDTFPGQAFGLEVEEVLFSGKSKYQDVLVFRSKTYGNVLVLDGIIQCTERDEFSYQEMISFLPLNSHPNPKKVLIIGGGDGGVAREVAKHPSVESVVQCEIDETVVEVSKKFLPKMAAGLSHPKVTLYIGDGFEFMKNHHNEFDVIIADISDPEGPAESLFGKEFHNHVKDALKSHGIMCVMGECLWLELSMIKNWLSFCKELFPVVSYAYASTPTYTCGMIGFVLCSLDKETKFNTPLRVFTLEEKQKMDLKYYNKNVHQAAFVLPEFARKSDRISQAFGELLKNKTELLSHQISATQVKNVHLQELHL